MYMYVGRKVRTPHPPYGFLSSPWSPPLAVTSMLALAIVLLSAAIGAYGSGVLVLSESVVSIVALVLSGAAAVGVSILLIIVGLASHYSTLIKNNHFDLDGALPH